MLLEVQDSPYYWLQLAFSSYCLTQRQHRGLFMLVLYIFKGPIHFKVSWKLLVVLLMKFRW